MAMMDTFICTHCGYAIEAWSDGNPYFLSYSGKKQYYYHPSDECLLESYKMQYMEDCCRRGVPVPFTDLQPCVEELII